jgi:c-di-GMP-binding flagellar brake protein YcgR
MDSTVFWGKAVADSDVIGGDRRQDRRYHLQLEAKWKLIRRRRLLDTGSGRTVDISSGGIRFDAGRRLPDGLVVELSISWPVLLHNEAPLQLVVTGKIVRCDGREVAIQTTQHEFRTAGVSGERRAVLTVASREPSTTGSPAFFTVRSER